MIERMSKSTGTLCGSEQRLHREGCAAWGWSILPLRGGSLRTRPSVAAFDRQPSQGGRCPDAVSRRRTFRSGRAAHRRRRRGFRSLYGRYAAGSGAPFGDRTLAENRRRAASLGRFFGRYASQVSGQGRGATLFLHQPCGLREGYRSVVGALYDRSGARG